MSKIVVISLGAALFLGFLIACVVIGFALLSGSQADVGYEPGADIGTGTGIDAGYGDYDTVDTFIGGDSSGDLDSSDMGSSDY